MSAPATTRTPLPEGTLPVGVALLIAGVATYAFFKIGTWAVGGADEFKPISSLWFATFALAPGFFLPLEQELGRALSQPPGARSGRPAGRRQGRAAGRGARRPRRDRAPRLSPLLTSTTSTATG